jgi:uncharacterized protein YndB with AHSA1/START domain
MQIEKIVTLPATPTIVWRALTDPVVTKRYYFGCEAVSDWEVGSPVAFSTGKGAKKKVHVTGEVTIVERPKRLGHTCIAAGADKSTEIWVEYTLKRRTGATELHVVSGEFPDKKELKRHENSWDKVLTKLEALLAEGLELEG